MATDFQAGFIALNRFGLGSRRGGDLAVAASDPRGLLEAELATPGITVLEGPELPRTALALKILFSDLEQKRLERLAAETTPLAKLAEATPAAPMQGAAQAGETAAMQSEKPKPMFKPSPGADVQVFRAEASARLRRALRHGPVSSNGLSRSGQPFLCLDGKGRFRSHLRRRFRARGYPAARTGTLPRDAASGREPSGNAVLSR